jgi:hypothetical protein
MILNACLAIYSWEASAALKKFLKSRGIQLDGAPGGWAEVVRAFRECKVFLFPFHKFRAFVDVAW